MLGCRCASPGYSALPGARLVLSLPSLPDMVGENSGVRRLPRLIGWRNVHGWAGHIPIERSIIHMKCYVGGGASSRILAGDCCVAEYQLLMS